MRTEEILSGLIVFAVAAMTASGAEKSATGAKMLYPCRDAKRQTVISEGGKTVAEYQGHPTTVVTEDGRILCVWTIGHGGPCGPAAESCDNGKTWKRIDERFPEVYRKTHANCPTLQKCRLANGKERLLIFSAKAKGDPMPKTKYTRLGLMLSDDGGRSWREGKVADLSSAMPPTGFMPLKDGTLALFGQVRDAAWTTAVEPDDDQRIWMSVSKDGGETWGPMRVVATRNGRNLCEPCCIRSPDGRKLMLIMRENRHLDRSMFCVSENEGVTWSAPQFTAAELTGDRHEALALPDGRYLICFRNQNRDELVGQYVGFVGTWDDIVNARPGQYRLHLLRHYGRNGWPGNKWDTGYSGVELLKDGSILCTTYSRHFNDARYNSIVSVRLNVAMFDVVDGVEPECDETAAIQAKIDAAWRSGGGKVIVPTGIHRVRSLRVRSNVELHLAKDAVLSASRNCDEYDILRHDRVEPVGSCPRGLSATYDPHAHWNNGVIRLVSATNVVISGEPGSAIDGNNSYDPRGEEGYRGAHGISCFYSTNVIVRGVEIRNTGNWAHRFSYSADLLFKDVKVRGGHDGVHVRGCDRVRIVRCDFRCGDDAVAGYDNCDVTVEDCLLNTACSAFRFGGTHVRVRRCRAWGPAEWPFRNTLTMAEKRAGVSSQGRGRKNMLSFWTYFADRGQSIRFPPGDIVIEDCTIENADRLLHYNFSGNEAWQQGEPLGDIRFERVQAKDVGMSLCAYAAKERPLALTLKDCDIAFRGRMSEFIRAAHIGSLVLEKLCVKGVEGPCVRTWSEMPPVKSVDCKGIDGRVEKAMKPFSTSAI